MKECDKTISMQRATHGNRKKCGRVLAHVSISLLFSVFLVTIRLDAAGSQKCDAIFQGGDFFVTQTVLDEVKDDFQKLIDCIPDGGKLSLTTGLNIKPIRTVVMKNAIELASTGNGKKRPVFTCPDAGEPLFEISSTEVELKNFIVSDCISESNVTSAVVVDIKKTKARKTTSLGLTGVDFVNNTNLKGSASIYIKSAGSLSLTKVAFSGNVGAYGGGAFLDSAGMEVNLRDCVFENNIAKFFGKSMEGNGAALFQNASAFLTVSGSRFLNNYAGNVGGAMFVKGEPPASTLTIKNTEFHNNTAGDLIPETAKDGGAIFAAGPTLEFSVKNCTLTENKAAGAGGGIYLVSSRRPGGIKADIVDTVFKKNVGLLGGAIWALANLQWRLGLSISDSKFLRNAALMQHVRPGSPFENATQFPSVTPGRGGAITCIGVSVDLKSEGNLFKNNRAVGLGGQDQRGAQGGAILITDAETVTIRDTVFRKNSAKNLDTLGKEAEGGAIHITAVGIEAARVLDSPTGSQCALQCDGDSKLSDLGILNPVAGCGLLDSNSRRVCVLKNATECEGFISFGSLHKFAERPEIAALCEIVVINSTVTISDSKFVGSTVDGPGGAIFLKGKAAILALETGVGFVRNTAKNSTGGALFISDGATVVVETATIVKDNVAGISGGGIFLEGTSAKLDVQGGSFVGNSAESGVAGYISSGNTESNIILTGQTASRND